MLKKLFSKIKIKTLIEIFLGISLLFIPFFVNYFKTPANFNFTNNSDEQIFVLPDSKEEPILNLLDKATNSIDITIYLLSDRKIIEKIKELKNKNINIRIILEKAPFGGGSGNYKVFNELLNIGINIKYSDPRFALTHAKYIVIDKKEAFIMTSNLTYSGLNNDRDFIFYTSDNNIINELNNIFENDFNYKKYKSKLDNLVVSPDNSRNKIESLINSATKSIYLYGENIGDKGIEDLLIKKSKEGVNIKLILPDNIGLENNIPVINKLKDAGIEIKNLKKPYQHAKILIINNSVMYLGSVNFSTYSMDRNREVGVISLNRDSIDKVSDTFNNDLK